MRPRAPADAVRPAPRGQRAPADVRVAIGELVLHGLPASARYAVGDALQAELTRLLADHGVPAPWGHDHDVPALDAGRVTLSPSASAGATGRAVARAVYERLSTSPSEGWVR